MLRCAKVPLRVAKAPLLWIIAIILAVGIGFPIPSSAQLLDGDGPSPTATNYPSEAILGEWCTTVEENRPPGRVRFQRQRDGTYIGIFSWSSAPKNDVNNKDPKLRDRPLVGIVLIWNLRFDDGEYVDGYIYNPEDGGTYRVKAEVLGPEQLKVRGFLGISLFGQSKIWTRYHAP